MIKFFITGELSGYEPELNFLLTTWAKNSGAEIQVVHHTDGAIRIGQSASDTLRVSTSLLTPAKPGGKGWITHENGSPDYIATAFYLINSLQEYNDTNPDELGRFRFTSSMQHRLRNTYDNIVQQCFDEISKAAGIAPRKQQSKFFLTHDIDMVFNAIVEDGFNVLKKGRVDHFFQLLFHVAMGKPDWLNIDKIMKLESEYDCKSVFYWIVNKGKINQRERNADYSFRSAPIQKHFRAVEQNGFENSIHKSISSETFQQEFGKYGSKPVGNRYHYLKYNIPAAYHAIEEAGLKLDASLGFAEEIGFRNNYGLPFNPYNVRDRKPFSFVEAPLHVMDRTFFQYKQSSVEEAEKSIISFFEKNRENCVLSVLWHNNFFSNYKFKGYPDLYKKILAYIRDRHFATITQEEIINAYSIH